MARPPLAALLRSTVTDLPRQTYTRRQRGPLAEQQGLPEGGVAIPTREAIATTLYALEDLVLIIATVLQELCGTAIHSQIWWGEGALPLRGPLSALLF